jgi:CHAT domain-containing protein
MRFPLLRWAPAVLVFAVTAAGGALAQQPAAAPAAAVAVGADLLGKACHWQVRTDIPIERNGPAPANVYCGEAKRPAGFAVANQIGSGLPAEGEARHQAIERAAGATLVGADAAVRLTCSNGTWQKTSGGLDLLLQQCRLNSNEWPQVVAVAAIGSFLVRGEGLPSALPALEQAMGRLVGLDDAKTTALFGDANAARDRLVALGGDRWIRPTSDEYDSWGALTETARVEGSRKNFASAEDHYRRALTILTDVFGPKSPGAGLLLIELALQVSNQERFEEAAALFREADPIIQTAGTAADRARLLLYLAFDAANRGQFDEALNFAGNAATTWRDILNAGANADTGGQIGDTAFSNERGELAFTLDLAAEMALRTGNLSAADGAASEAALIIGTTPTLPPWWKAEVLTTMGEIRAAQGRMDDADANFRAALILQQRLFGNTAPTALTYLILGRAYAGQRLYPAAVRAFELGLEILRTDEVARSEVVVDQMAPFIVAANALAESNPSDRPRLEAEMFEASQLIGKSLVDETVNRVAARLAGAAPQIAGLVNELEQTRRERDGARIALAEAVSLPADQRGSDRENALLATINTANAKADALSKRIEAEFPDYSNFAHPGPVSLAEMQKLLRADEALVLLEAGRERGYVLLVRKDRVLARPMGRDAGTLGNDVAELRKAFVVRGGAVEAFDTAKAYSLYRGLFGAVEPGLEGVRHLIAVTTASLSSLPLGLLVTRAPAAGGARDYTNAQWLVRRMAISEIPSARAFAAQRDQPITAATRPFLGVADPAFAAGGGASGARGGLAALDSQCRDAGPFPAGLLRGLPPLPETADEVRRVAAILHADSGSLLIGGDASEARLRAMPLNQYRVLYFATHGLLPTALRCQSEPALVLTPPRAATSRADDGVLDASEVAQLHLSADLVVLSACNTAVAGNQFGGESLSGLAKSFFHAGARAVLASHWEVPSAQTVQLMTGMFEKLGPNLTSGVAESLRQAQLALIAKPQTAHPFFWAAFTVIGDGGVIGPRRSTELTGSGSLANAGPGQTSHSERRP